MPYPMHNMLKRQLKRHLGRTDGLPSEWLPLIEAVNDAYHEFDKDRSMIERSLELSSEELVATNVNLRESEERYRTVLDSTTDMAFVKDEAFRYVLTNKPTEDFFRRTANEMLGKTDYDLMPKPMADACRASDQEAIAQNGVVIAHEEVDGRIFDARKFPLRLKNGKTGVGAFVRDITESKRAEAEIRALVVQGDKAREALLSILEDAKRAGNALKENTVFLNTLLDAIPVPVFYKDTNCRYIGFNKAFEVFFGKKKEELVGKSAFDINSREMAEVCHSKDIELFAHPGVQVYDTRMKDGQGRMHDVVYHKATFTGADAQVRGLVGAILDITDRKQAAEAVTQSRDYLDRIINAITDPIFVKDRAHRFSLVNDAFCALAGCSRERLIGNTDSEFFPAEQMDMFWKKDEEVFSTGLVNINEEDITDARSGEIRTIITKKSLYTDSAGKQYLVGVIRDISERKYAEEQIQKLNEELEQRVRDRTAQLEAANQELESFSYSVSHDLRAPLRAIDGFSQHVLEEHKDRLAGEAAEDLARVRAAAQRMSHLIDDMLSLSRLTRQEMRVAPVDLSRVASEIVSELQKTAPARKVELVVAPGVMANGDERLLRQVLQNLLSNAWKFTGKTDKARIEFGVMDSANGHSPSGQRAFFVRDNGAGFDMAYAKKLFGAFQRLHSEKDFEGTGIGLAIVQRIIHRHGGEVWAESEVGKGTTFYFTI